MTYQHQPFPAMRYGPGGATITVNSEEETPKGFYDHPSKIKGAAKSDEGTHTAVQSPNGPKTSRDRAAKTTDAVSRAAIDVEKAKEAGVGGVGNSAEVAKHVAENIEIDADGHPYDPALHASTRSKTRDGKWRMKVGVTRPAPAPGYPLDL